MVIRRLFILSSLAGVLAVVSACSSGKDQPRPDRGPSQGEGAPLFPCNGPPGSACNAHNACVQSAFCKEDGLCHPESVQDCSDDLECTVDSCKGQGVCSNEPKPGFCAIAVKGQIRCFADKSPNPDDACQLCDSKTSPTSWTAANGGPCDDGVSCTKDDYCQSGVCKGTAYSCDDKNACTDDICDGKGGCSNPPKGNICVIGGGCQNPGDKAPGGCGSCDPQKSTSQWTLLAGKCFVDSQCYDSGQKAPQGCSTCDPAKDAYHFSPPVDVCDLGSCLAKGQKGVSGCTVCDPVGSPIDWAVVSGAGTDLTDFESGLGKFTASAPTGNVGWQVFGGRFHSGKQSLYYGNPAQKNYDSGSANSGTATRAGIVLPPGQKAGLVFWLYMDVEQGTSYDVLSVTVGGKEVWKKDNQTMPSSNFKRWIPVEVSLWSFAGSTVDLVFKFETKDGTANATEGVYVDDVRVITNCGALPQPTPFVMDGKLDGSAKKVAGGTGQMSIYAALSGGHLYLATEDAGEGNDNFILISNAAPGTLRPAPWNKAGSVAFPAGSYFAADENDNTYCGWFRLGDTLLVSCGGPFVGLYAVATPSANGGVLEASINLQEVFGTTPSVVYLAAAAYGTGNSGKLAAQTPPAKNGDGNIDGNEILKLSIPGLTVLP